MIEGKKYICFEVLDSFGKLLGFKSDYFWALGEATQQSIHALEEVSDPQSAEMKSLAFLLNHPNWWKNNSGRISDGRFDEEGALYVVAKDHETKQEKFRYAFSRDEKDVYSLSLKNGLPRPVIN